jgi:hypothetical protein
MLWNPNVMGKSTSKIVVLKFMPISVQKVDFFIRHLMHYKKKTLKKNFLEFLKNGHKCPPCPLQVLNTNYLMVKKYLRDKENIVTLRIQGKYI